MSIYCACKESYPREIALPNNNNNNNNNNSNNNNNNVCVCECDSMVCDVACLLYRKESKMKK